MKHLGKKITAAALTLMMALGASCPVAAASGQWRQNDSGWWYALNGGGWATGWQDISGSRYYFSPSGYMQTGWIQQDGNWYYLSGSGRMATGWTWDGSGWYYFDSNGVMQRGWLSQGGKWYYLTGTGKMATGWVWDGSGWYYLNSSGVMQTGWTWDGSNWYYLSGSGKMTTGWILDGGSWYFLATGQNQKFLILSGGGSWYFLATGQNQEFLDGSTASAGVMLKNRLIQWKGQLYWLGSDGKMTSNGTAQYGSYRLTLGGSGTVSSIQWNTGSNTLTLPAGWTPVSLEDKACTLQSGDARAEILADPAEEPEDLEQFAEDLEEELSDRFELTITVLENGVEVSGERQIPETREYFQTRLIFSDGEMITIQARWTDRDNPPLQALFQISDTL